MVRLRNGLMAFVVVGGLASLSVLDREVGGVMFFWVFFGGIAGAVALVATGGRVKPELDDDELAYLGHESWSQFSGPLARHAPRPRYEDSLADENGVVRYPGDEFDIENFPTPGACGRF
jgi:hypothetical protein